MDCPGCGAANPEDAKFCGSCGNRMDTPRQNDKNKGGGETAWGNFFKWVGIVVVGLFVLGVISGL